MGYVLLVLFILLLTWPLWRGWFYRFMQRRAEDTIRRMMGLPSRKEEQRRRKAEERRQGRVRSEDRNGSASATSSGPRSRRRTYTYSSSGGHIIPPEYAVDVEFTEIKEFRQTEINGSEPPRGGFGRRKASACATEYTESQVEDVEFTEIKRK